MIKKMKKDFKKLIFSACVIFLNGNIFAQKTGTYTIMQDDEINRLPYDSVINNEEYINSVYDLMKITRENMNRQVITEIPENLKRFYIYDYADYDLKNTMAVDSAEGVKVRKSPSLNSEKICVLPDNFNVVVTCLGPEATVDNIKSAWVEILVPEFLWKTSEPEFGWVFGGYLKDMVEHKKFSLSRGVPFTAEEFMDNYYKIPYKSAYLYDVVDGYSFYDLFCNQKNKSIYYKYGSEMYDEYRRVTALEKLKLIHAGVMPLRDDYFEYEFFAIYWDRVQEMRQMHAVSSSEEKVEFNFGIHTDETLSLSSDKTNITYKSSLKNKTYKAEIPSEYFSDFVVSFGEELEIRSFNMEGDKLPGPIVYMRKKVNQNKAIYNYELFYYTIVNGKLAKFLQIITYPDIMSENSWDIWYNEDRDWLMCSEFYNSLIYGLTHDDCIYFRKCNEYPYIEIAIDACNNYEVIQTGKVYNKYSD